VPALDPGALSEPTQTSFFEKPGSEGPGFYERMPERSLNLLALLLFPFQRLALFR